MVGYGVRKVGVQMKISPQRILAVVRAFSAFRNDLAVLHSLGEGGNGCIGWPECDCRLAEEIRIIVQMEEEWRSRRGQKFKAETWDGRVKVTVK